MVLAVTESSLEVVAFVMFVNSAGNVVGLAVVISAENYLFLSFHDGTVHADLIGDLIEN